MSFLGQFLAKPAANAPAAPNAQPEQGNGNPQQNNQQQQQPQGQQPNGEATPNNKTEGTNTVPNPLDIYNPMFQNDPNKQTDAPPSLTLDPKILDQVSGSMNFFDGIPAELMTRANGGDMQAIMEVVQHSNRNAYRSALTHSSALTDKFVGQREEHFSKRVPNVVRDELTMGALTGNGEGGAMHPVVRKQLAETARLIQKANPDASPQEVAASARKYIMDMANAINPQNSAKEAEASAKQNQGTDWDAYFDADNSSQQ